MYQITPFRIDVPQSDIDDLTYRLKYTRWTDEPRAAGWNYGTNPQYLRELAEYWLESYDWRAHEAILNTFPQFIADIEGVKIHFLHIKASGNKPVILSHGWPDSFYRYYKVIPLLVEAGFDVVVPSLPGFGFSDKVALNNEETADIWVKLMGALGYQAFFAAGGDFGATITKAMANLYPNSVKAIFLTDLGYISQNEQLENKTPAEEQYIRETQDWLMKEGAYAMAHSTKPQTLGYALNDSPVGLASWIIEKFYTWSDCRGNLDNSFTKNELLTNIMIYWITQTINTSIRSYQVRSRAATTFRKVTVPTAVALFPADSQPPREYAERFANVQRFTVVPRGGHFAPLEEPELWVREARDFFDDYVNFRL
ncbi:epoxide hydrolase [Chitinophaga horti]|uniref:Epoxide hydrolase n=1 Tax=Chitinophaga horti TaxID=2920382 RepID=A0ABY6IY24_9BACT|nr:epoxide hydrolase family protein [Chitinophaga horti]UYQ90989.1 epoxide hydrolase [Chitinophaga horti]